MIKRAEVIYLDIDKMLAELRVEREQIEEAILTLERLARGRGRRRGRPPSWLKEAAGSVADLNDGQPAYMDQLHILLSPGAVAGHQEVRSRSRSPLKLRVRTC